MAFIFFMAGAGAAVFLVAFIAFIGVGAAAFVVAFIAFMAGGMVKKGKTELAKRLISRFFLFVPKWLQAVF